MSTVEGIHANHTNLRRFKASFDEKSSKSEALKISVCESEDKSINVD